MPQAASQAMPQAVAAPPAAMLVAVPAGVSVGQQMQVRTPDGQQMIVTVPAGVAAGQQIQISYTPLPQPTPIVAMGQPVQMLPSV